MCQPDTVTANLFVLPRDGQLRAHGKRRERRHFDVRTRKRERAQRRDLVGCRGAARSKRVGRQPADIAVGFQLSPGPAFVGRFVDHDALAEQRFGVEPCVMRRCAAQRRDWLDHLVTFALDKALAPRPGPADVSRRFQAETD